jgi:two-component system, cell cycle sensor histidine kinase and response regulator CckA
MSKLFQGGSSAASVALDARQLGVLANKFHLQIANIAGDRELILIVDDEPNVCLLAQMILCEQGYKVITAYDGTQALEVFDKIGRHVGLVILDFIIPGRDGEAIFYQLKQRDPNVAVLLSSGYAEHPRLTPMVANGLAGFIPKPYSRQRLLDQVRSTLDQRPRQG